ncbi:MAG: hypothetical protein K6E22_12690 [Treponema sp.]|nr:hypothetical protein [Treponema sp.]
MNITKSTKALFLAFAVAVSMPAVCPAQEEPESEQTLPQVSYRIKDVQYTSKGITQKSALKRLYKISKKHVFESKEELDAYVADIKQKYDNTRLFSEAEIKYKVLAPTGGVTPVVLEITVDDAHNLLALPKPSYNSNNGANLKVKMKDKNFLGTLNTFNLDVNAQFGNEDEPTNFKKIELGSNFDFDYPFDIGITENAWTNDVSFSWTLGEKMPEYKASTGIKIGVPFGEDNSFNIHATQSVVRDMDYAEFDDEFYFVEEGGIDMPLTLGRINKFTPVVYTPSASVTYNWDKDGISSLNEDLFGPTMKIAHRISINNENWKGNFRDGYSESIEQGFSWNFKTETLSPSVELEAKFFTSFWDWVGITVDTYYYVIRNGHSNKLGGRLRGIKDEQEYRDFDKEALDSDTGLQFSIDMPVHIITTHWMDWGYKIFGSYNTAPAPIKIIGWLPHKICPYLDFEFQLSPFMDIGLTHNEATDMTFNYKDGFYAAGLEALFFMQRWKSFVVRASMGVDIGRWLGGSHLNQDWREQCKKYEFTFGLGLQY